MYDLRMKITKITSIATYKFGSSSCSLYEGSLYIFSSIIVVNIMVKNHANYRNQWIKIRMFTDIKPKLALLNCLVFN